MSTTLPTWCLAACLMGASAVGAQETESRPAPVPAEASASPPDEAPGPTPAAERPFQYQLGLALSYRPTYAGSGAMGWGARPVMSLRWGRWRLTSSTAGLIEGSADSARAAGASVSLAETERWSAGAALRFDNGRQASDDPKLAGLPEVKRTLRGRVYARYALDTRPEDRRSVSATLSTDLAGRQGGTTLSLDWGRQVPLGPTLSWGHGVGLGAADAVYMRSHHGVPPELAPGLGLPAYVPSGGLTGVGLGTGLTWKLHPSWRVGVSGGLTRLLGPAAHSPLTGSLTTYSVVMGVVYLSGRE